MATSSVPGHWRSHHWCASLPICSGMLAEAEFRKPKLPCSSRRTHSPSYGPWKFGLSSVSLASGIALGRERPSVQVGAGIASLLGRYAGLSRTRIRLCTPSARRPRWRRHSIHLLLPFSSPRGSCGRSSCSGPGLDCLEFRHFLDCSAFAHWRRVVVPCARISLFTRSNSSFMVCEELLVASSYLRQPCFGFADAFLNTPKSSEWAQPAAGGLLVGLLGWFVPGVLGVGNGYVRH